MKRSIIQYDFEEKYSSLMASIILFSKHLINIYKHHNGYNSSSLFHHVIEKPTVNFIPVGFFLLTSENILETIDE